MRITLTDTMMDVFVKMSEGNPGALTVLMELHKHGGAIDPQGAFGGFGTILSLDEHYQCYGSNIWVLFKNVCGENLGKVVALDRANQLGFCSAAAIRQAVANASMGLPHGLDVDGLLAKVQGRLEEFRVDARTA